MNRLNFFLNAARVCAIMLCVVVAAGCKPDKEDPKQTTSTTPNNPTNPNNPSNPTNPTNPVSPISYMYPGFNFTLSKGMYWKYEWTRVRNGVESEGTKTITLGDPVTVTPVNIVVGELVSYRIIYTWTGNPDDIDLRITTSYEEYADNYYLAVKNGIFYSVTNDYEDGQFRAFSLFDSQKGTGGIGFVGFHSDLKKFPQTGSAKTVNNPFSVAYSGSGVEVYQKQYQKKNEMIGGEVYYGNEEYDYDTYEYYLPNIGFCGYYEDGSFTLHSSVFPYYATTTYRTENVWLVETNVK